MASPNDAGATAIAVSAKSSKNHANSPGAPKRRGSAPGERRGGRQKGTPNKITRAVKELAGDFGPEAVMKLAHLAGLVKDKKGNPIGMADSQQLQLDAANDLLDRAYGKPSQMVAGDPDSPVQVAHKITVTIVDPKERGR